MGLTSLPPRMIALRAAMWEVEGREERRGPLERARGHWRVLKKETVIVLQESESELESSHHVIEVTVNMTKESRGSVVYIAGARAPVKLDLAVNHSRRKWGDIKQKES